MQIWAVLDFYGPLMELYINIKSPDHANILPPGGTAAARLQKVKG